MYKSIIRPKLLAVAVASALAGLTLHAHGAAVTLTAFANPGSTVSPGNSVIGTFGNGGDFLDTVFSQPADPYGSLFYHTYGFPSGVTYFGARVSGEGTFYGKTSATYVDSYTNTSGVDQVVTFSYTVDSSEASLVGLGTGFANLTLALNVNGNLVSGERVNITQTAANVTCNDNFSGSQAGALANFMTCDTGGSAAYGSGGTYSYSQVVGAGQSFSLQYDIIAEVSGSAAIDGGTGFYCSYGPVGGVPGDNGPPPDVDQPTLLNSEIGYCASYNALTRSGDPAGFAVPGNFSLTATPLSVPEPGSLALVGLAIGGLAAARRRRKAAAG